MINATDVCLELDLCGQKYREFPLFVNTKHGGGQGNVKVAAKLLILGAYGNFKIPNHNTQITNNIKITNSNDQNITLTYWMSRVILSVLNFEFRSLVSI